MTEILVRVIDAYVYSYENNKLSFLLLKRSKTKIYEHLWQGVAGKIEKNELAWEEIRSSLESKFFLREGLKILKKYDPNKKIAYVHSERFVSDMVKSLQLGAISEFKQYYRSLDALLIDDIQFFAKKEQSQEELFHTFNSLIEGGNLMIFSCDRYPKEIEGLEERLKSRFGWGLSVVIDPPESLPIQVLLSPVV